MSEEISKLVEERNKAYGEAWKATSLWIGENVDRLAATGDLAFPLIMIHNKLTRALASPGHLDHYRDIQGYAQLILDHLKSELNTTEEGVYYAVYNRK